MIFTVKAQPVIQFAIILNGSGSINAPDWILIRTGLANAVSNPAIMPQTGSVELTIVQFGGIAQVTVPPTVITPATVVAVVATINGMAQPGGMTAMADAISLAWATVSGSANFDPAIEQIINLATDGMPNVRNNAATSDLDSDTVIDAYDDVIAERDNAVAGGLDEFDVEGIAISIVNRNWFRDYVVYPPPGYVAPPFIGPGWIRVVADATEFAATIDEKIEVVIPPPRPVGGEWVAINKSKLLAPWIGLASLLIVSTVAVSVAYVKHRKKKQT